MNKDEIIQKLNYIKSLGRIDAKDFIDIRARDDGEFGRLIEKLFDVKENNLQIPDLGTIELKSYKTNKNKITLKSSSPIDGLTNREIYELYKYPSKGFYKLNSTVTGSINKRGFWIKENAGNIEIYNKDKYLSTINFKLEDKLDKVLFVLGNRNKEGLYIVEKTFYCEGLQDLKSLIDDNVIVLEFRFGVKKDTGGLHDHGIALRLNAAKINYMFKKTERWL